MASVLGVVLAGGGGKRLGGVVKAKLKIGDASLFDRLANALRPQCDDVVVSSGRYTRQELGIPESFHIAPDAPGAHGPVAGLAAAVDWTQLHRPETGWLLTAAVDTPFFPQDFIARAQTHLHSQADCIMGMKDDQIYPTNALWRLSALTNLPRQALQGRMPQGLKRVISAQSTAHLVYDKDDLSGCFFNINTDHDLEKARQMVKGA